MSTPQPNTYWAYYRPTTGPLIYKTFPTQQAVDDQLHTWLGWTQSPSGPPQGTLTWTDGILGPSTSPDSPASATTQETTNPSTSSSSPT